jgi:hypothetical protein
LSFFCKGEPFLTIEPFLNLIFMLQVAKSESEYIGVVRFNEIHYIYLYINFYTVFMGLLLMIIIIFRFKSM